MEQHSWTGTRRTVWYESDNLFIGVFVSVVSLLALPGICTRVCTAHYTCALAVEDIAVSILPAADISGKLSYEGSSHGLTLIYQRRVVANRGSAPQPVHGKSERQ